MAMATVEAGLMHTPPSMEGVMHLEQWVCTNHKKDPIFFIWNLLID